MMINTIGYVGKVSIKVKNRPPVKTSNAGTKNLFELMMRVVTGNCDSSYMIAHRPFYVDVVCNKDSTDMETTIFQNITTYNNIANYSVLLTPVQLSSRLENSTGEYANVKSTAHFEATLNTANLKSSELAEIPTNAVAYVCLINAQNNNILAVAPIGISIIQSINDSLYGQATLSWDMTIGNIK